MTCIKTGCHVSFPQYGQVISADVFRVGTALVIRTQANQVDGDDGRESNREPELRVVSTNGGNEFWRIDLGVLVVPEDNCHWYIQIPY